MGPWLITLIAVVSVTLCLFLWFRDVRRIMGERKSTLDSAAGQLAACRDRVRKARDDPDAAAILKRSEDIYQQAATIYDRTIKKPWVFLPARLMGFQPIS